MPREATLEEAIEGAITGDVGFDMFFYDELPSLSRKHPEWGAELIRASARTDIQNPRDFLEVCARALVNTKSKSPEVPGVLERALSTKPSLYTFYTVWNYTTQTNWEAPPSLRRAILTAFSSLRWVTRQIFWLDFKVRSLVKLSQLDSGND